MKLIEADSTIRENVEGLYVEHTQAIPSEFLDTLKSERHAKTAVKSAEYERVASVPTFVWELWIRQGRDPFNATPRQIVGWLQADDLGHFITTPKRV